MTPIAGHEVESLTEPDDVQLVRELALMASASSWLNAPSARPSAATRESHDAGSFGRLDDALAAGGDEPLVRPAQQGPAGVEHHGAGLIAIEALHVDGDAEVGCQVAAGRGLQHPVAAEAAPSSSTT